MSDIIVFKIVVWHNTQQLILPWQPDKQHSVQIIKLDTFRYAIQCANN